MAPPSLQRKRPGKTLGGGREIREARLNERRRVAGLRTSTRANAWPPPKRIDDAPLALYRRGRFSPSRTAAKPHARRRSCCTRKRIRCASLALRGCRRTHSHYVGVGPITTRDVRVVVGPRFSRSPQQNQSSSSKPSPNHAFFWRPEISKMVTKGLLDGGRARWTRFRRRMHRCDGDPV